MDRFNLGPHSRKITTTSPEAQRYFNLGLNWTYAFNHEEAGRCFLRALDYDPDCAMAHWGIAYSAGPFYNMPWWEFSKAEAEECTAWCHYHFTQAKAKFDTCTDVEKALIAASSTRVKKPHRVSLKKFDAWDDHYAKAMRRLHHRFPDDPDITVIFIEALMARSPWRLWDIRSGEVTEGADTLEALKVCEVAIKAAGEKVIPALYHLHIHLLEMSAEPERALPSCAQLSAQAEDAPHLAHMPAHIHVQCGQYSEAIAASEAALENIRAYADYAGPVGFYLWEYAHSLHLMIEACCHAGQFARATQAAAELRKILTPEAMSYKDKPFLRGALDEYSSKDIHVMIRFGQWDAIIAQPNDRCPQMFAVAHATQEYGRAVAHANLGNKDQAKQHLGLYEAAIDRLPGNRLIHNNPARAVLDVGLWMARGEAAWHSGARDEGLAHLRRAVEACDALAYAEPWAWMHPPRHALGALLIKAGQFDQAETVFREDLGLAGDVPRCCQHRGNIWALKGLTIAMQHQDKDVSELSAQLEQMQADADFPVRAACCCADM